MHFRSRSLVSLVIIGNRSLFVLSLIEKIERKQTQTANSWKHKVVTENWRVVYDNSWMISPRHLHTVYIWGVHKASTKTYIDKNSFYHLWQFEWNFEKDKSFKDKMASVTTDYCTDNSASCALKEAGRLRWSLIFYRVSRILKRRRPLNRTHCREWR